MPVIVSLFMYLKNFVRILARVIELHSRPIAELPHAPDDRSDNRSKTERQAAELYPELPYPVHHGPVKVP